MLSDPIKHWLIIANDVKTTGRNIKWDLFNILASQGKTDLES